MWELTKSFRFEAAHALPGTTFGEASEEIQDTTGPIDTRFREGLAVEHVCPIIFDGKNRYVVEVEGSISSAQGIHL